MIYNIDFWLTTYCQARCRSCARTDQDTGEEESWLKKTHMEYDVFLDRLEAFGEKFGYIQFCGEMGDPCMHPKINEFITASFKYTDDVHLLTNGGLRNPDWYKKLAKVYTNFRGKQTGIFCKFGVDGTDHDTNWLYREGVQWQKCYDNMSAYFGAGGRGSWHFLIFDWNWHQIPDAINMAKDMSCQLDFKFNNRNWGKITPDNKRIAIDLLKENNYVM